MELTVLSTHVYTGKELAENKIDNAARNGTRVPEDMLPHHRCIVKYTRHEPYYEVVDVCYGQGGVGKREDCYRV